MRPTRSRRTVGLEVALAPTTVLAMPGTRDIFGSGFWFALFVLVLLKHFVWDDISGRVSGWNARRDAAAGRNRYRPPPGAVLPLDVCDECLAFLTHGTLPASTDADRRDAVQQGCRQQLDKGFAVPATSTLLPTDVDKRCKCCSSSSALARHHLDCPVA